MSSLDQTVSKQGRDIQNIQKAVEDLTTAIAAHTDAEVEFRDKIEPLLDLYNGGLFAKNLFMGTAAFIGSLVALGASIYAIISFFKHF